MAPKRLDAGKPNGRIRLSVLLACVFVLKFVVFAQLRDNPLIQFDSGLDTTAYASLANRVVAGDWALGPGLYFVSPLYIYFLALCLAALKSYTMVRVVQIALGTASIGLIFLTARGWFGERAAWIAALLAAFTGLFTFYEILILQSSIDAFLTSAALYALMRAVRPVDIALKRVRDLPAYSRRYLPALLAGVVLGLQTLNRPNTLIAATGIAALALAVRRPRLALTLAAGIALGTAPVAIRNVFVSHEWTFVSSHGGLNFYIGNSEKATGFYQIVPGVSPTIGGQQNDVRRVASRALGRDVTDAEASEYFFARGRAWIQEHPGAAIALFGRKLLYVFNAAHLPLPHSYPFYAHDLHTALRFYLVGAWLIVPLGLVGLILCAPARGRREYLIWASFVPFYALSVAVFFVAERYRLPLLVPLCVTAGAAVDRITAAFARHTTSEPGASPGPSIPRAATMLASAAAVAIPVNWPLHVDDGRWVEGLRLTQQLAIHHRYDEAEAWVKRLDANRPPTQSSASYGMGAQLLVLNLPDRALPYLGAAYHADPKNATFEYGYGQALFKVGRTADAIPHLKRGFEAGIELPAGGFDYPDALRTAGDFGAAADAVSRINPPDNGDAESWLRPGRLAMEVRAPDKAERFFRGAVELAPDSAAARQQYGLNLLILGRFDEAAHELGEAVRYDPKDPDSLSHLAYCEAKLGRADDARLHAQAALAIDPSNQLAQQLIALLRTSPDTR